MKELLDALPHKTWTITRDVPLVDTCFFLDELHRHRQGELGGLGLLSFNAEELVHVSKHLPHLKQQVRKVLKEQSMLVIDVPVHPGDRKGELAFVRHVDPHLLNIIADPSDAVLIAAAMKTHSPVLTKDKHHLFTAALNNYTQDHGVRVFKEMKDYERWRDR